jgi:nucleoside-diphosphate-sugar epimerase
VSAPLVVTGASGFVGRRLLAALAEARVPSVRVLARSGSLAFPQSAPSDWRVQAGDLTALGAATDFLTGADTVIHLAARTGKGTAAEHFLANREATRALLQAAASHGVRRFLFVSSIAAGFADQRRYHYALAKAEAEALVRSSGLETLIVRPTMVFGPSSPSLANLRRLALLPVPIVFGPGNRLQPIHVDDLAEELVATLGNRPWPAEPVDLGGPTVIELVDLVAQLRRLAGRPRRRPWHVPIGITRGMLAAVEPVVGRFLPITAGQLAAFANPSVARPSPYRERLPPPRRGLAEMLAG